MPLRFCNPGRRRPSIGAGLEVALVANWSAKAEYLYADTGKFETAYSLAGLGAIRESDRITLHVLRAGVNYRF